MKKETAAALKAAVSYIRNKAAAIAALAVCLWLYNLLPADRAVPFVELLYAVTIILWQVVMAPLARLLVFPEAAAYAESGGLGSDLEGQPPTDAVLFSAGGDKPAYTGTTNRLRHYWFATGISYLVTFIAALAVLN